MVRNPADDEQHSQERLRTGGRSHYRRATAAALAARTRRPILPELARTLARGKLSRGGAEAAGGIAAGRRVSARKGPARSLRGAAAICDFRVNSLCYAHSPESGHSMSTHHEFYLERAPPRRAATPPPPASECPRPLPARGQSMGADGGPRRADRPHARRDRSQESRGARRSALTAISSFRIKAGMIMS